MMVNNRVKRLNVFSRYHLKSEANVIRFLRLQNLCMLKVPDCFEQ